MRSKITLATVFLLATVFIGLMAQDRPVTAQDQDSVTHPVVATYAEVFTVSEKEALRRLELQNEMIYLSNILAEKAPDYAGSWIQHKPEFRFSIAFITKDGEETLQKYLDSVTWADIIDVKQVPYTLEQLVEIQDKVYQAMQSEELNTPFESGVSLQRQKVVLYTPDPDSLRSQAEASLIIKQHASDIEFVFQETLSEESAFLDGGMAVSPCTTGFVVRRQSDSRRFISTAGHCSNTIKFGGTNIGSVVFENNPSPTPPVGSFGRDMDFQTHDALAAGFDLRNIIQINPDSSTTSTESVVSYQFKDSTENSWVCKNGKITNQTCGTVTNITYAPTVNGITRPARYVRVDRPSWATYAIACPGDSGGPVYKYVTGGVSGLGIQNGGASSFGCDSGRSYFYYTPVDEIDRTGHSILTYSTSLYQHVFWSATNCTEYKTFLDAGESPVWNSTILTNCSTYAPGSGPIQSYTTYISGGYLREAMWRNNQGWIRSTPISSTGSVNWGSAPGWSYTHSDPNPPKEQGAYVIGNSLYQHVFWSSSNCEEFKTPLNSSGNPIWSQTTSYSCNTFAPGSGIIQSYTTYVSGGHLREAMWRGNQGWIRSTPISSGSVNWGSAPGWSYTHSDPNPPKEQGAYILTHP